MSNDSILCRSEFLLWLKLMMDMKEKNEKAYTWFNGGAYWLNELGGLAGVW